MINHKSQRVCNVVKRHTRLARDKKIPKSNFSTLKCAPNTWERAQIRRCDLQKCDILGTSILHQVLLAFKADLCNALPAKSRIQIVSQVRARRYCKSTRSMNIKVWEESVNMYKNRVSFLRNFVSQDVLRVFARTFVEPYIRISGGECGI